VENPCFYLHKGDDTVESVGEGAHLHISVPAVFFRFSALPFFGGVDPIEALPSSCVDDPLILPYGSFSNAFNL